MSVLALDVGERRIGVAISDPGESFAMPLEVIERSALRDDIARIVNLAEEHRAGTIIVGDPIRLSGERGPASEKIDRFVEQLARAWSGAIERVDERLTTAQATRTLLEADVSRKGRRNVVDKLAAALMLETYLARRRPPN